MIDCVHVHNLTVYAMFYSVVYHQDGLEFTLEGDEIPGFLRGSKKGNVFITTQKVSKKNVLFSLTSKVLLG